MFREEISCQYTYSLFNKSKMLAYIKGREAAVH
jgi:hypothetical protein